MKDLCKVMKTDFNVLVIMSTYNGERYLREQLNSLIYQKDVSLNVLIRDDGSTDNTVNIIRSYMDVLNIKLIQGKNLGASRSFYMAAQEALLWKDCDYYAFCDQDDIWKEEKISMAIAKLKKFPSNVPQLYYSNLEMIDNEYNILGNRLINAEVPRNSQNALACLCAYGCTFVFNKIALKKFCKFNIDKTSVPHDFWMYSICSLLGNCYYDSNSYIMYRRSGNNVTDERIFGPKRWLNWIKKFIISNDKQETNEQNISRLMIELYGSELGKNQYNYLIKIRDYKKKMHYKLYLIFTKCMKTSDWERNLCNIVKIMTNRL